MSMHKPLEALLRPPVEWYSTGMAFTGCFLIALFPNAFMVPKSLAEISALALLTGGLVRFKQGYRVWRYQRNLKRMSVYKISSHQLPISHKKLFLGKGFLWTPQHTQRLRDLDLAYNLHYKYPSPLKRWARKKELQWEHDPIFQKVLPFLVRDSALNPFRPYPDIGGEPCIHGIAEKETNVAIHLSDRASHMVVVGLPGMGKTRFAEIMIGQDIRRGDVVIVIDPKGDADLLKRIYTEAKTAGRENSLLVFHLGFPEISCRYNPIGNFTRVTEVANRISNQLPSSGDSAAFKEFGWQFINSITMALVSMGQKPDYQKIKFYITKMDVLLEKYLNFWLPSIDSGLEQWIEDYGNQLNDPNKAKKKASFRLGAMIAYVQAHDLLQNPIFDDLHHAYKYDTEYFSKITASLGPLLKKLTTGKVAELLSPNYEDIEDKRLILDWLQVIRNQQIVYVGLDSLTDREVSTAVGNAMFADLVSVAGRLYKFGLYDGFYKTVNRKNELPIINVHADEINETMGDESMPLFNKGRGAGFRVTAYTQTWSDMEVRLKTAAKAGQAAGNLGAIVMFRCTEAKTVEMLLGQLPTVPILRVIPGSSSSDTPHGDEGIYYSSTNEDRFSHSEQRLIEQTDVLNLPKGQAFCLLEGGKLYKLRMPLPQHESMDVPNDLENMLRVMRERIGYVDPIKPPLH
jgi:conjugative coupling factor TraD (TOL family)